MKLSLSLLYFVTSFYFTTYCQCTHLFVKDTGSVLGIVVPANINCSTPYFVDIDNDGDQDIFVGNIDGTLSYYQNTGTNTNPAFILLMGSSNPFDTIDVGNKSLPAFVDIDNDADMDAFIGEDDGNINYYKNTGTSGNPIFTNQTGNLNPFNGIIPGGYGHSAPAFVDIDNDGDLDAFIGEYYGRIFYYKNTGTSTNPIFASQTGSLNPFDGIDVGTSSSPIFVDIDQDGDQDAFIGEYNGTMFYYKNDGTMINPVFSIQTSSLNPFDGVDVGYRSCPAFTDIDNDGDLDAIIGTQDGYWEHYKPIYYYKNTGNSSSPLFVNQVEYSNAMDLDVGDNNMPTFVDIDNDGDYDSFVGEFSGDINYYQNTGTSTNPIFLQQSGSLNPFNGTNAGFYSTPTFVDIDDDGDFDAFVGTSSYLTFNYYKNTGTATNPVFINQTGSSNPCDSVQESRSAPAFVDIDNDGDFDAFVGEYLGNVFYYQNTGTSTNPIFEKQTAILNPFNGINVGSYSHPTFVDFDYDGDWDAFIGSGSDGHIYYFENTGTLTNPVFINQTGGSFFDGDAPAFVDIDNDGDQDAFIGDGDRTSFFNNYCDSNGVVTSAQAITRQNPEIKVFPNPANKEINIELPYQNNTDSYVVLFDVLGKKVLQENTTTNNSTLFIENLQDGVYFLQVECATEKVVSKVIIKH